jgi:hypothetical protein
MLARYLAGWAQADPAMIAGATAADYDFDDPLVGHFSKQTLPQYFALVRARFAVAGVARAGDVAFMLRGPMSGACDAARRRYWREAALLGLTGVSEIMVTPRGIAAEAVAYDLNIACDVLRGCAGRELASREARRHGWPHAATTSCGDRPSRLACAMDRQAVPGECLDGGAGGGGR